MVLAEHLQSAKKKPKYINYFSKKSQNKIIDLGETNKKMIISKIKNAKYITIMLNLTPDIAREDQVFEILRYVHIDKNKNAKIKETFLRCFQIDKKMQKAW